ncbi:PspC domain-containing protein [Flavobacterium sp.]|uniref:PspC domain-containing protein n=1 Tax=Flavobacterium sp. TaxID=239 RepID=UPI00262CD499|nr:PspC domain-containing protein [Flavobacterium sp.]
MNKTVSMNLGGFFFHIDENAYQKLNRYFDAIKRSLSNEGRDEIMNDIESRISELFSEKLTSEKQVLGLKEVDEVIAIMGQPEDYRVEDDSTSQSDYTYTSTGSKKLYRDKDSGILGGVAAGLGHYFGIDVVWIRIILVLLVVAGFGTGILAYLVLWIVTPEAVTTSEKLEMKGEPITISNIEKKVKEEFENVSDKFKNADYNKMGSQVKNSAERIGGTLADVFTKVFGAFAKVLGVFILIFSAAMLIGLIVGFFALGTIPFIDMPWQVYADAVNYTSIPFWLVGILGILAIGIPFFFLFILGLKLLVTNLKSLGSPVKYTLLALWIIAIGILISLGIKQATESAFEGKISNKQDITLVQNDTLKLKFRYNDLYTKNIDHREDFEFVQDAENHDFIYSNNVELHIVPTQDKIAYMQIEKVAEGKTLTEAKKRAEKIKFDFKVEGNTITLDNYLLTEVNSKYRNQKVKVYLYLPEGTLFYADETTREYIENDHTTDFSFDYDTVANTYKIENKDIKCLTCPPDLDGDEDDDDSSTSVIINEDGVKIKNDTVISNNREIKELKINEDGIIIKTK